MHFSFIYCNIGYLMALITDEPIMQFITRSMWVSLARILLVKFCGTKLCQFWALIGSVYGKVSRLNRFFGMCTSTTSMGLYVPFSCWWTADKEPQLMQQLSDYTEGDTSISSVDVDARLAFFILHDKLSTVSLDTGKIGAQFERRSTHYDLYQHQSSSALSV